MSLFLIFHFSFIVKFNTRSFKLEAKSIVLCVGWERWQFTSAHTCFINSLLYTLRNRILLQFCMIQRHISWWYQSIIFLLFWCQIMINKWWFKWFIIFFLTLNRLLQTTFNIRIWLISKFKLLLLIWCTSLSHVFWIWTWEWKLIWIDELLLGFFLLFKVSLPLFCVAIRIDKDLSWRWFAPGRMLLCKSWIWCYVKFWNNWEDCFDIEFWCFSFLLDSAAWAWNNMWIRTCTHLWRQLQFVSWIRSSYWSSSRLIIITSINLSLIFTNPFSTLTNSWNRWRCFTKNFLFQLIFLLRFFNII